MGKFRKQYDEDFKKNEGFVINLRGIYTPKNTPFYYLGCYMSYNEKYINLKFPAFIAYFLMFIICHIPLKLLSKWFESAMLHQMKKFHTKYGTFCLLKIADSNRTFASLAEYETIASAYSQNNLTRCMSP
jgi:hypothetical protein